MSRQNFKKEDSINITLLLAHARCMSELIHTLPQHKYEFKTYFRELFETIKKYEIILNKLTNYNENDIGSKNEKEVYDMMMEVTYDIRNIIIEKFKDENDRNNGSNEGA